MGSFYHDNMVWTLRGLGPSYRNRTGCEHGAGPVSPRVIFSGLLAALGILEVVVWLLMPGGGISGGKLMIFRTATTLLFIIPTAVGLWWLVFFTRKDLKAYFQAGR